VRRVIGAVAVAAVVALGVVVILAVTDTAPFDDTAGETTVTQTTVAQPPVVAPRSPVVGDELSRKLDYRLAEIAEQEAQGGTRPALREARRRDLDVRRGMVRVVVESEPGGGPDVARLVQTTGGVVEGRYANLTQALVAPGSLRRLARDRAVAYVRPPKTSEVDSVEGQGVVSTNAAAWHAQGWTGKGVTIAIIDGGFGGLEKAVSAGDLPTGLTIESYCANGGTAIDHGTAVAEIVHEVAPDARLLLLCRDTEVEMAQAAEFARDNKAVIVSQSMSAYNTGRGDGRAGPGMPDSVVADMRRAGILWVNSAGNRAQSHWSGTFSDPDANGFHNFAANDETNSTPAAQRCVFLKWDEWPAASDDFNLYVYQGDKLVAQSENVQTGTQAPVEELCLSLERSGPPMEIKIARKAGTGTPRLDLFVLSAAIEYQTPAGSLTEPGSSSAALAVGAICWKDDSFEEYSSQGPTIDGRTKPDIAGPDSVSGVVYGAFTVCADSGFAGTSAATPHVAALAALVKQRFPSYGPDELQKYLVDHAVDLGVTGADDKYGAGKALLPQPVATP
jgi:subtilisin family serine protease